MAAPDAAANIPIEVQQEKKKKHAEDERISAASKKLRDDGLRFEQNFPGSQVLISVQGPHSELINSVVAGPVGTNRPLADMLVNTVTSVFREARPRRGQEEAAAVEVRAALGAAPPGGLEFLTKVLTGLRAAGVLASRQLQEAQAWIGGDDQAGAGGRAKQLWLAPTHVCPPAHSAVRSRPAAQEEEATHEGCRQTASSCKDCHCRGTNGGHVPAPGRGPTWPARWAQHDALPQFIAGAHLQICFVSQR